MEEKAPEVYAAILEADKDSQQSVFPDTARRIAQGYNHMILPLANRRDKLTQVQVGHRGFREPLRARAGRHVAAGDCRRYRDAEVLAEHGILFTILAPRRPSACARRTAGRCDDVSGARIDPRSAYRCELPSEKPIESVFLRWADFAGAWRLKGC